MRDTNPKAALFKLWNGVLIVHALTLDATS